MALFYFIFFGRLLKFVQYASLLLLVVGMSIGQWQPGVSLAVSHVVLLLALIATTVSTCVSIYTEYLFKVHTASFNDQQLQMYGFSVLFSLLLLYGRVQANATLVEDDVSGVVWLTLGSAIGMGALFGLVAARLIKHLDNIVKSLAASVASVLNGVVTAALFPGSFEFHIYYLTGSLLIFLANVMYSSPDAVLNFAASVCGVRRANAVTAPEERTK